MDISTQDIAQPTTAAEVMAYTIDTKAEWRDARWWPSARGTLTAAAKSA